MIETVESGRSGTGTTGMLARAAPSFPRTREHAGAGFAEIAAVLDCLRLETANLRTDMASVVKRPQVFLPLAAS